MVVWSWTCSISKVCLCFVSHILSQLPVSFLLSLYLCSSCPSPYSYSSRLSWFSPNHYFTSSFSLRSLSSLSFFLVYLTSKWSCFFSLVFLRNCGEERRYTYIHILSIFQNRNPKDSSYWWALLKWHQFCSVASSFILVEKLNSVELVNYTFFFGMGVRIAFACDNIVLFNVTS